jgi:parallel beta-helix repeat protein
MICKKTTIFFILSSLFYINSFSSGIVYSCTDDPNSPGLWTLNNSISINGSTCLNIASANIILDCQGYSITGNGTLYGIRLDLTNITVQNCIVQNFSSGIVLDTSADAIVVRDNIVINTGNAIYAGYTSSGISTFFQNTLINNTVGIRLEATHNNTLYSNSFSGNAFDLNIHGASANNTFYLNQFENSSSFTGSALNLNFFNTSSQGNSYGDFNGTIPFCFSGVCDYFPSGLNSPLTQTNTQTLFSSIGNIWFFILSIFTYFLFH